MENIRLKLRLGGFLALILAALCAAPAQADTLERIKQAGKLTLGYRADARPFSFDAGGKPDGYTIGICNAVVEEVKAEIGRTDLAVEWVPIGIEESVAAIRDAKIDLLCGAEVVTLERRKVTAFSIPIFQGGLGALLPADAPLAMKEVLSGTPSSRPSWRGSPARILDKKTFAVVGGTRGEGLLAERIKELRIDAQILPVDSYTAGIQAIQDRKAHVFFGDRAILVDTAAASSSGGDLVVLDRLFTSEPIALSMARNDDDFRLAVDRALSKLFTAPAFKDLYLTWFGEPDLITLTYFHSNALME